MFDVGPNIVTIALALIAIIPGAVAAYYARQARQVSESTQNLVNGRMGRLIELTEANARSEGVLAGAAAASSTPADAPAPDG